MILTGPELLQRPSTTPFIAFKLNVQSILIFMYIQGDEMGTQFKYSTVGILSVALAMPLAANATSFTNLFTFDPTGGGVGTSNIALIDQAPGNAYAQGGMTAIDYFLFGSGLTA